MIKRILVISQLVVAIFLFLPERALTIPITGDQASSTEGLANFAGQFVYTPLNRTQGRLTVTLTNTTPEALEGYLVAFAFNNPDNLIKKVTFRSTSHAFDTLLGGRSFKNRIKAYPFGRFDIGLSTSGTWAGRGSPKGGIQIGATETFTFKLEGTNLHTLTEQSFVNELTGKGRFFAARFKGLTASSDRVPAIVAPVPEPAPMLLLGAGLVGLAGLGRRRLFKN